MLEFIKFDKSNEEHMQLARDMHDVIFEDECGIVRIGHIFTFLSSIKGTNVYHFTTGDYSCDAHENYFCKIVKKG